MLKIPQPVSVDPCMKCHGHGYVEWTKLVAVNEAFSINTPYMDICWLCNGTGKKSDKQRLEELREDVLHAI